MDQNRKLNYWVASLSLGHATADQIASWTDELMNQGVYRDEFIAIMDSKPPRLDDVREPFVKVMTALGYPLLDQDNATRCIIDYYTASIAEGAIDPLTGLKLLFSESYQNIRNAPGWTTQVLDKFDGKRIETLYWTIWQIEECAFEEISQAKADKEISEQLEEIKKEAIRWQTAHGGIREKNEINRI